MSDVRPFHGFRYSLARAGNPAKLVAPALSQKRGDALADLAAQAEFNIARLLMEAELNAKPTAATVSARLRVWAKEGVLRRDPEPSYYLLEQVFSTPAGRLTRRACIGVLDTASNRIVLPHTPVSPDQGFSAARHTNVCPLTTLYHDVEGVVETALSDGRSAFPDFALTDKAGTEHRLFVVRDPHFVGVITKFLEKTPLLLAGGQAIFQGARTIAQARHEGGSRYVLSAFVCSSSPNLHPVAAHRVVADLPRFEFQRFNRKLQTHFDVTPVDSLRDLSGILRILADTGRDRAAFGVIGGGAVGRRSGYIAALNPARAAERLAEIERPDGVEPSALIDTQILNELVFKDGLGLSAADLAGYVQHVQNDTLAMQAGRSKQTQLLILMNPTSVRAVRELSQKGCEIPPHSLAFFPDVLSGLVLHVV